MMRYWVAAAVPQLHTSSPGPVLQSSPAAGRRHPAAQGRASCLVGLEAVGGGYSVPSQQLPLGQEEGALL